MAREPMEESPIGIAWNVCDDFGCWCIYSYRMNMICGCTSCHGQSQKLNMRRHYVRNWNGSKKRV